MTPKTIQISNSTVVFSVTEDFSVTATDGKNYRTKHYNLDAISFVRYMVIQDRLFESDFDREVKDIEEKHKEKQG